MSGGTAILIFALVLKNFVVHQKLRITDTTRNNRTTKLVFDLLSVALSSAVESAKTYIQSAEIVGADETGFPQGNAVLNK